MRERWSPLLQRHAGVYPDDLPRYTALQLAALERYVFEAEKREIERAAVMPSGI